MVRKIFTQGISIFQVTFAEESILNLPFSLLSLRNGSTLIRVYSINAFKQELLPLIHLLENIIFNIFDPDGLKLFTRLRLGFSHLDKNRFRHNFQECFNTLCTCGLETGKALTIYCIAIITFPFALILLIVQRLLFLTLSHYQAVKTLKSSYIETFGEIIIIIIFYKLD